MSKLIITKNNNIYNYSVATDISVINKPLSVWKKFTSYLTDEEISFLEEMKNKDLSLVSFDELDRYKKIQNQLMVSKLIDKYKNQECNIEEHDLVYKFVNSSLNSFINEKISEEEKISAFKYINELTENNNLDNFIKDREKVFDELSAYEAFVLIKAKERQYTIKNILNMEKNIKEDSIRNKNLIRHLIFDYGLIR